MRFSFGTCVFDTDQRLLARDGTVVHLPPKALHLLEVLIQNRPRVVGRDELHRALWPKTFVARTNLPSLVVALRAAIGDLAHEPRFIRTVHAVGYAFAGDVMELPRATDPVAAEGVRCRLILGEREVALRQGENVLGRTSEAAIWLDDENVSRLHAQIVVRGGDATLEDLGSKNGTYVGKKKIIALTPLQDKDVIWVGPFSMTFRIFAFDQTTRTAAREGGPLPRSRASEGQPEQDPFAKAP